MLSCMRLTNIIQLVVLSNTMKILQQDSRSSLNINEGLPIYGNMPKFRTVMFLLLVSQHMLRKFWLWAIMGPYTGSNDFRDQFSVFFTLQLEQIGISSVTIHCEVNFGQPWQFNHEYIQLRRIFLISLQHYDCGQCNMKCRDETLHRSHHITTDNITIILQRISLFDVIHFKIT